VGQSSDQKRCLLSVIVPTLDEEATLPALLACLGSADEVLVVDGGSEDGTADLAREAGARVLESERGRGRQLALGAAQARGELLLFLHADSRLGKGALGEVRTAFGNQNLAYAGLNQRIDHPGRLYRWIEAAANGRVRRGMVYGDSGLCVRRSAYAAVGGFGEQPLFEDLDLSQRLREHGQGTWIEAAELVISARRWEREGIFSRSAKNWALTAAFRLGVDPGRLVRYYSREPKAPKLP
jgi:rSAM/selenodomain-associated transferase 2